MEKAAATTFSPTARIRTTLISSVVAVTVLAASASIRLCFRLDRELGRLGEFLSLIATVLAAGISVGTVVGVVESALAVASGLLARAFGAGKIDDPRTGERARNLEAGLIAMAAFAVMHAAYGAGYDKIHRAINFVHRRIDPTAEYVLWPEPLATGWLMPALLPPAVLVFFLARRMLRRLAFGRSGSPRRTRREGALVFCTAIAIDFANSFGAVNLYRYAHVGAYAASTVLVQWWWLAYGGRVRAHVERIIARPEGTAGLGVLALSSIAVTHVILSFDYSIESLVFMRTNTARENVRFLRALWDRDRDGASPLFGGDDRDDSNPKIGPWTLPESHRARRAPNIPKSRTVPPTNLVVLITIDALRFDMIGEGPDARMPNLARFADGATRFDAAYSQAPFTNASFRSIFYSVFPCEIEAGMPMTPLATHLRAHRIESAGIVPGLFDRLGFDVFDFTTFDTSIDDTRREPTAKETTDRMIREIRSAPPEKKRLVWAHYFDPHTPIDSDIDDATAFENYAETVRRTDFEIGRLLEEVSGPGHEATAVIIGADHGDEFGDHGSFHHGFSLYESAVHVPMIMRVPRTAPRRITTAVENIDIAPTIAELLHVPANKNWRGFSLVPLAENGDITPFHGAIVSETEGGLIAYIDPDRNLKLIWHRRDGFYELYDLKTDAGETTNLVDSRPYDLDYMRRGLADWARTRGVTIDTVARFAH